MIKLFKKEETETQIERYNPTFIQGLSDEQVKKRMSQKLVNKAKKSYSKSYGSIIFNNIFTFFNFLGLIVTISLILVRAEISRFFFVIIYIANILIGIIQEIRAKKCVDKLTLISSKTTVVIRNGEKKEITSNEIVLDDILYLVTGNQITTDSEIVDGFIEVNESLLTGESVPVKKQVGDKILAGSFVTSGTCYAKAISVGSSNYAETISEKAKKYKKPKSELMNTLHTIIKFVGFFIIPLAIIFIIKGYLNNADTTLIIDRTSAFVIGMIPSGMFLLTSMALAVGIIRLYKNNTLVQDLYSLEMLARVDTICFDKTGTITDGRMTVKELVPLELSDVNLNDVISSMLYSLPDNNQTSIALINEFTQNYVYDTTAILPFNSMRKYSAVTLKDLGTYSLGAPEFILNKQQLSKITTSINQYASKGFRVILLAHTDEEIEEDKKYKFTPKALIVLEDNIREDAINTVKWLKENDVKIKVISGDNPLTVSQISQRVGIDNADKYISLEGLTETEVMEVANKYTVFGRVTPEQKELLIKSIKAEGHTTAMTGDGVNDILALKEADCAISIASGSDAAKNISHLILMDNNFNSIPKIIHEGRRVINNIQSSASLYLMKTIFTFIIGILSLILMPVYQFNLSNLTLLEVLIIGIPSFFLSLQPNDSRIEGSVLTKMLINALPSALCMVLSVCLIMVTNVLLPLINITCNEEIILTMKVFTFTFAGLISLFAICRPFNVFKSVLFVIVFLLLLIISIYGVQNGITIFSITPLWPIETYWPHILIVIFIITLEIPILMATHAIIDKIKIKNAKENNALKSSKNQQ